MAERRNRRQSNGRTIVPSWLDHHRAMRAGWRQLCDNGFANGVGMLVMAIALALPATLFALFEQHRSLVADWGEDPGMTVFLDGSIDAAGASGLAETISGFDTVDNTLIVPPERAYAEFAASLGLEGMSTEGEIPLPFTLVIEPRSAAWNTGNAERLAERIRALPGVEGLVVDLAWVERLAALTALAERGLWVLAIGLLGGATLIVGNTIRAAVHQYAHEIEVQELVGATDAYIRRPFLYSGVLQGALAGALAVIGVDTVILALGAPIAAIADAYGSSLRLESLNAGFTGGLLLLAAGVGWIGAWIGTTRSLVRLRERG